MHEGQLASCAQSPDSLCVHPVLFVQPTIVVDVVSDPN